MGGIYGPFGCQGKRGKGLFVSKRNKKKILFITELAGIRMRNLFSNPIFNYISRSPTNKRRKYYEFSELNS